ncbi:MAG: TonB-dependent receptor, partial [Bacteroidetes bacterium]|nr:TonB-dependent receptor [Bacteroidota bacterium]
YQHQLSGNLSIDAGISMTAEQADIDAYNGRKERELFAAFANGKYHFSRINWDMMAGARQEFNGHDLFPFTPAIGIEGPLFPFLSNKISISRNYRLPTMNELYWQPGGNPDIKPENSWNAELSMISEFFRGAETHGLKFIATAYSSMVDDWILWLPKNNFWTADNVQKVWARGIEVETNFQIERKQIHAELGLSYTYSVSSNESKDAPGDTYGKQLIYTPLHNASGKIGFSCRHWQMLLFGNYTGESYTTTDNLSALPGFYLMDISLKKEFVTKLLNIGIAARLNNIFNKDYQLVAYRPMPGRNFNLSISLNFKN